MMIDARHVAVMLEALARAELDAAKSPLASRTEKACHKAAASAYEVARAFIADEDRVGEPTEE